MRKFITTINHLILDNYVISGILALVVFLISLYFAFQLKINSNQLDLLPDELPQIQEARKINTMVGGTGYIILTIKHMEEDEGDKLMHKALRYKVTGKDKKADEMVEKVKAFEKEHIEDYKEQLPVLKEVSNALYDELGKMEEVRYIQHKFELDFITRKILYFWETPDLKDAFRRVSIKRDELIEKANPFYIDLGQRNYNLDLTDLMEKYTKIGKQQIVDEYLVSPDMKMLIMFIKPNFSLNEIEQSRDLTRKIQTIVDKLELHKKGVQIGLTGSYVQFVDAYDSVKDSLEPTMLLSLLGIALVLLLFVKRRFLVLTLLISLIYAIVLTFGMTYLVIGRLNIITAIFGGILAGLGIDYGIHFIFRFLEEVNRTDSIFEAARDATLTTGAAAIYSATTTAAAFGVLIFSGFQGFSEFGMISAYGIVITALTMFFFTPLQLVILSKVIPGFHKYLRAKEKELQSNANEYNWINFRLFARVILPATIVLFSLGLWFAPGVRFDDDYRNMLEADIPSEIRKQEIQYRYEMSGDPMGIVTENLEDASSLWQYLQPLDDERKEWVAQLGSIFSFVPPSVQQLENYKEIRKFKYQSRQVSYALLPQEYKPYWKYYKKIMSQKPYTVDDVPEYLQSQFKNIPSSPYKGWMTLIYPDISKLNTAEDISRLDELVGIIHYPVVGRHDLERIAYEIPKWEKEQRRRIPGSTEKKNVGRMMLSEKEVNGILDIVNNMNRDEFINRFHFMDHVNKEILENRPFQSIDEIQKTKKEAITTGSHILISKFIDVVRRESRGLIFATIVLIVLIIYISFRSFRASFIALSPLAVGLAIIAGVMTVTGLKLNYFNVVIFPIIIGYGLDNGIFIFHRFMENGSISHALYTTGRAVTASSLTTLAGWGSLSIAVHPGIRSMGFMAILGVSVMLVVSVTMLPAMLQFASERKYRLLLDVLGDRFQKNGDAHKEDENSPQDPHSAA